MNSGGHRGFTTVTIITLIFAPFFMHHQWMWRFVGQTKVTHVEQCAPKQPCPAQKVILQVVQQPAPPGGTDTGGGNGGGNQGQGDQGQGQGDQGHGDQGHGDQGHGDQGHGDQGHGGGSNGDKKGNH